MERTARKVMYLRPVGACGCDGIYADMAARCKLPDTEVHIASLPPERGRFTHIEYRAYEAVVASGIVRATRAAAKEGFDALAIGCFYDTALRDAREVSGEMAVTAPCLASCRLALNLSNRFGVIVGRRKWVGQMSSTVEAHGFGFACAGFFHVGLGVNDFQADHDRTNDLLTRAARKAVEESCAESIILGCTREIGFHETLEERLGVPVIDAFVAALKEAEHAAEMKTRIGWKPSRRWSCEAPPEVEIEAAGAFDGETFGNRIVVPAG